MTGLRLAIVLAGILLLAGLILWAGLPAIGNGFAILGAAGFLIIVLAHLPLVGLMGLAWWSIGRGAAQASCFIVARLVRDAVAELLPFSQVGGFAAGVRALSLAGVPARTGASSLFADLLMEFLAKLPYALLGLGLLAWLRPGKALPSYVVLTIATLVGIAFILWLGRRVLSRFVPQIFGRWLGPDSEPLPALDQLLPSALLHLAGWILGGLEAWLTLRLMGMAMSVGEALVIDSLGTSLRTFGFFVPAALGVQEAAYVLVCGLFGLGPGTAMAFSLVRRARDVLLGLAGLAVWQKLELRHRTAALPEAALDR